MSNDQWTSVAFIGRPRVVHWPPRRPEPHFAFSSRRRLPKCISHCYRLTCAGGWRVERCNTWREIRCAAECQGREGTTQKGLPAPRCQVLCPSVHCITKTSWPLTCLLQDFKTCQVYKCRWSCVQCCVQASNNKSLNLVLFYS